MTRALYYDGPAVTISDNTGDLCLCGLGVGTAPALCPLHPPRHSPYGVELTVTRNDLPTGCAVTPPPTGPALVGVPGVPVIRTPEDAARLYGVPSDPYDAACETLARFAAQPPPVSVKVNR
jgi:hypothetical protein